MGMIDNQLVLAESQAVTSTDISENVYDTGAAGATLKNLGTGRPLYAVILVKTAATSSGNPPVTFTLETDSTANLATSATVHDTSSAYLKAALIANTKIVLTLKSGQYERYLGVRATVGSGGPLTAGAFSIYITDNLGEWQAYPDAI